MIRWAPEEDPLRIFISHSNEDKAAVARIISRLKEDGHDIWVDSIKLRPGDNIQRKIAQGLDDADALVVVVSKNSFRSKWVQHEFSAIALRQISKRERRIIPVRIDRSEVPSYLADRVYVDLSEEFEAGLEKLSQSLRAETPESIAAPRERITTTAEGWATQTARLRESLRRGRLTLICGAGVSVEAGIPAWGDLLIRLLDAMMERISKDYSLKLSRKAASEFHQRHGASSLILGKYLKNNLGRDFRTEMRNALYSPEPAKSPLLDGIVRLARPQRDGKPLDSIISFNFDCLIEENLSSNSIRNRPIFSESIRHDSNELPISFMDTCRARAAFLPIPNSCSARMPTTANSLIRLAGPISFNSTSSHKTRACL